MTPEELAKELGKAFRLSRIAQGLRREDLVGLSQASLQAIKNLESGGKVELLTFLRVAGALNLNEGILQACQPVARSLDGLEKLEEARTAHSRVRIRR